MKGIKGIFVFSLIILLSNLVLVKSNMSFANPVALPEFRYSGGLLPPENVSLSLISANVIIDADTSNLRYLGGLSFQGNYTIFNPENDLNLTIAAPFNINPEYNLTVLVNSTLVSSDILYYNEIESDLWADYIDNISSALLFPRYWILCNVSIPKNQTLEIYYEFNNPKPIDPWDLVSFDIIYDVGTARLWNGNITEKVEIRTHGYNPKSIYNEDLCSISNISDGNSHIWEWFDKKIEINFIGVHYYYENQYENQILYISIKIVLFASITIISFVIVLNKMFHRRKTE